MNVLTGSLLAIAPTYVHQQDSSRSFKFLQKRNSCLSRLFWVSAQLDFLTIIFENLFSFFDSEGFFSPKYFSAFLVSTFSNVDKNFRVLIGLECCMRNDISKIL